MPRVARIVVPGEPHHVVQRGNDRQEVYLSDDDREFYLNLLRKQSRRYGLSVLAYALMPNHVHLIVVPMEEPSLARGIGRTHFYYTCFFNQKYGRCGHLWQNRFFSCTLDEPHFYHASKYVERNPVRAGLASQAWEYPWSSAVAHVKDKDDRDLLDMRKWPDWGRGKPWRKELQRPLGEEIQKQLRRSIQSGHPLGSDKYLDRLERKLGKALRPKRVGRPRKPRLDEGEK